MSKNQVPATETDKRVMATIPNSLIERLFGIPLLAGEEWADVEGYEGLYAVSNLGRVLSLGKTPAMPKKKARVLRMSVEKKGYVVARLTKNGKEKDFKSHRLVAHAFLDLVSGKEYVNHKDGVKAHNTVYNLEWCTSQENQLHAYKTGLKKSTPVFGEQVASAKLTVNQVLTIRQLRVVEGHTLERLAALFQVSSGCILKIILRKTWLHI